MKNTVDKPAKGSQFVLLPCKSCGSDDVVYIHGETGGRPQYRVRCRFCGNRTSWFGAKHNAQVEWNEMVW